MKRILLAAFALFSFGIMQAQNSNMILFTSGGERFYAILNGLKMNEEPVTNLKIQDLNQPSYKLKVIFENTDLGEMDKNIYFNESGMEVVYNIRKNRKGAYKLAYQSATPINQAPPTPAAQTVVVFGAPAPTGNVIVQETMTTTTTTNGSSENVNVNMNMGSGTTVVHEEVTTTTNGSSDNVNMNVGINGFGMDVNVNVNDGMGGASTTSSTTTTTTTTTGGTYTNDVVVVEEPPCPEMGPAEFDEACSSIKSKSFADSKMTLAKQVVRAHCVSSTQVKKMMGLFSFEDDKLEFAKFAYDYTFDQSHYYKVNDAFTFESTIEELDEYISSRR